MVARQDNDRLVNDDGSVRFGRFDRPLEHVNLRDARPWSPLLPRPLRALRLKEWQAFQIVHERFFVMIALFNAKSLALVQVKIYDREEKKKYVFERKVAPWSFSPPEQLLDSSCVYERPGVLVHFRNHLRQNELFLDIDIAATKETPALELALRADASGRTPMVVSIPFAPTHGMYSHKCLMPIRGAMRVGMHEVELGEGNACMLMDDHKGYYPWVMTWDWVTSGQWRHGSLVGFNLTRNDSLDPDQYNENAFWIDGVLHPLPAVTFTREEGTTPERWRIRDQGGQVDVCFEVEIDGRVLLNLGLVESRYRGPFGTFSGTLRSTDGSALSVDGMFGMGEAFYLRV